MPNAQTGYSADAMTVCTDYLAKIDFCLSLSNTFGARNINRFDRADVIKFQCGGMASKPTINAAMLKLESIQPVANARRSVVSLPIDALTVSRPFESTFAPNFDLLRSKNPLRTRSLATGIRAELRRSFGLKCASTMRACERLRTGFRPRKHGVSVPSVAYPCKPDIFDATYEALK